MKNQSVKIASAAISDRGLSNKRPLNEDSFLADAERRIFAVADGVGGAQAGEVASQTAMEVLDEAFRHQEEGGDVEDLMEIAIQRANTSIYRMAREHPKLQMMATTIVALHLDGHIATIGHVGDSRLYRLTPDGKLHRETRDHSVVEEEVRAGRMTAAQAAHHPSRNVISRALGAEDGVEVDMKMIEVADGTSFLLCSDGITRHIPDDELRALLSTDQDLEGICAEMKERCFERGAEDNLTAVIVRVGNRAEAADGFDDERTITTSKSSLMATIGGDNSFSDPSLHETVDAVRPLSSEPPPAAVAASPPSAPDEPGAQYQAPIPAAAPAAAPLPAPARRRSMLGTLALTLFFLILMAGIGVAAFFGGMYKQRRDNQAQADQAAAATPTPVPEDSATVFARKQRAVDEAPAKMATQMASEQVNNPTASTNPEFLYLYGRALLLSGRYAEAADAFRKASEILKDHPARDPLKIQTKLTAAVAAMKSGNRTESENAANALDEIIDKSPANNSANNMTQPLETEKGGTVAAPIAEPR